LLAKHQASVAVTAIHRAGCTLLALAAVPSSVSRLEVNAAATARAAWMLGHIFLCISNCAVLLRKHVGEIATR
jgi:hypothetical protein